MTIELESKAEEEDKMQPWLGDFRFWGYQDGNWDDQAQSGDGRY